MKAFTVYQPYAHAIVSGVKHFETRSRRTSIRGRVAVHAGKLPIDKSSAAERKTAERLRVREEQRRGEPWDYPLGAVVGTVEIVDCVPVEEVRETLTEWDRILGDYSAGRFAWVLKDPIMFDEPVPARGQQGVWNWEDQHETETSSADL